MLCSGDGLENKGRRNALGGIVRRRRCEWVGSTSAVLSAGARSNSNVQCYYHVLIVKLTHNQDCKLPNWQPSMTNYKLCLLAQGGMKQMTCYFRGHIGQTWGRFELKISVLVLMGREAFPFSQNPISVARYVRDDIVL